MGVLWRSDIRVLSCLSCRRRKSNLPSALCLSLSSMLSLMVEWGVKETHDIQVPLLPFILVSAGATLTLISWQMFPDLQSHYPRPFEPGRLVSCPLHRSRLLPGQHLPTLSLFSPHWALHIHKMAKTMPESHETKVSFGHGQQQQRETWIAHCQKVWTNFYSFENIPSVLVHCNLEVENSSKDRILAWWFEGLHHSFPQHEKLFYHPIVDWWAASRKASIKQQSQQRLGSLNSWLPNMILSVEWRHTEALVSRSRPFGSRSQTSCKARTARPRCPWFKGMAGHT